MPSTAKKTTPPRAAKKPQDHKPKSRTVNGVVPTGTPFTAGEKTYYLPPITEATAGKVPGGITADAVMDPDSEIAQTRLALAQLDAVNLPAETRDALRSLPTEEFFEVINTWMGESERSLGSSESTEEPSSTTSDAASA